KVPESLVSSVTSSMMYSRLKENLATKRATQKDGTVNMMQKTKAHAKINRKVMLLKNLARNFNDLSKFVNSMILGGGEMSEGDGVNLLSVHASKGLEFKEDILYDFFPARLHKSTFPLKLWKRVYSKAINESVDLGMYSDKQGEYELRVEIAKYLNHSRAVNCTAEQIIMTNGFADSLSIIAMLFNNEIKNFSMEKPGYHVARKVFLNHNYNIDDISINNEGIDIKKLKQNISSLLYITPSH
ncbi:MAG: aminotransferase class I/II-fold pyridoxal phosphate-dependent enzyme, partial [Halarcobacter sp.]